MTGSALGVAAALAFLAQGAPAPPAAPPPTSQRVWAHAFPSAPPVLPATKRQSTVMELQPGAADSHDAERRPQFDCRMPVIQADPRVDPKMMLPPPSDSTRAHIRVIGELPKCPTP